MKRRLTIKQHAEWLALLDSSMRELGATVTAYREAEVYSDGSGSVEHCPLYTFQTDSGPYEIHPEPHMKITGMNNSIPRDCDCFGRFADWEKAKAQGQSHWKLNFHFGDVGPEDFPTCLAEICYQIERMRLEVVA